MVNLTKGDISRYDAASSVASTDTIPVATGTVLKRATPAQVVNAAGGFVLRGRIDDVSTAGPDRD